MIRINFIASLKGKGLAKGSSSSPNIPTSHHIPASHEVIEISDSDGPGSPVFTEVNQGSVKYIVSVLPETGKEVIELMSSDAEDIPQSPLVQTLPLPDLSQVAVERSQQPVHAGGSPDLPDLTPFPPQSSFPPSSQQLPEVSSPHEAGDMMDIDDPIQDSLPLPPPSLPLPPPFPSLPSPSIPPSTPQVGLAVDTVDTVERALSSVAVTVLPSPTRPPSSPHASEFVEDSEPETESPTEAIHDIFTPQATPAPSVENTTIQGPESDNDTHPPPPPSSSSSSHHVPLSRHPTPSVRCLLYGGPNGIFKDANTSVMQHIWATNPQSPTLCPPASPHNAHVGGELKSEPASTPGLGTPPIPDLPNEPVIEQVGSSGPPSLIST